MRQLGHHAVTLNHELGWGFRVSVYSVSLTSLKPTRVGFEGGWLLRGQAQVQALIKPLLACNVIVPLAKAHHLTSVESV